MKKKTLSNFVLFEAFSIACSACNSEPRPAASDKPVIPANLVVIDDEVDQAWAKMAQQNLDLLSQKKYDDLEKIATGLRKSGESFPSGKWKLDTFYNSFYKERRVYRERLKEDDYQNRFGLIQAWVSAKPQSVTAKVALAGLYCKYAWFARGGSYANKVSDSGWKLMAERNAAALTTLKEALLLPEKDPHAYYLLLQIAKDESYDEARYAQIFDESITRFPHYKSAYFAKVLDLQPRWGGLAGEWEQFIKESADKMGGVEGDKFYAQLVWAVEYTHWYHREIIFKEFQLDYPRIKRGMDSLRTQYPNSISLASQYCNLASRAGDKATAIKLFKELDGRVDKEAWSNEETYEYWRHAMCD
ncbi:DUF4034 domain-containing protein [bacterium]|nr:DUF4034 domain-containing protein [bacterium]